VDLDVGIPSRTTLFFVVVPSGEVVVVEGTPPVEDEAFADVLRSVALSIEPG
jgi:hypothetical protein